MSIKGALLKLLKGLFGRASFVKMAAGLLQGYLLSPILFNIFVGNHPKLPRGGYPEIAFAGKN